MNAGPEILPPGWALATISELCELNPKHTDDMPDDLPVSFVPMAAVDDTNGEIISASERTYGEVRRGYTHFADGDVLWAKITPCMENGKAAVARNLTNGLGCGTTEFFVLRSRGAVLPEYLHRFMRQPSYRAAARATMQSGVGQARVPKGFILTTPVPVPPLAEQRRIVAKLDELFASSRVAREALGMVPELLEEYRQAVLSAAFSGDLTERWRAAHPSAIEAHVLLAQMDEELAAGARRRSKTIIEADAGLAGLPDLPSSWRWAHAERCAHRLTVGHVGPMRTRYVPADGIPFLRSQNVRENRIDETGLQFIPRDFHEELAKSALTPGDVVIVRSGAPGTAAVVPRDLPIANCADLVIVRFSALLDPELMARYLNSRQCRERVLQRQVGVAQQHFNVGAMRTLPVPVIPQAEQREILRILRLLDRTVVRVRTSGDESAGELDRLELAALTKAFRGDLVPQDPAEEPASALLDRLRLSAAQSSERCNRRPRRNPS